MSGEVVSEDVAAEHPVAAVRLLENRWPPFTPRRGGPRVAKRWDRFACLEPNSGVRDRFGQVGPDVARGIRMCH